MNSTPDEDDGVALSFRIYPFFWQKAMESLCSILLLYQVVHIKTGTQLQLINLGDKSGVECLPLSHITACIVRSAHVISLNIIYFPWNALKQCPKLSVISIQYNLQDVRLEAYKGSASCMVWLTLSTVIMTHQYLSSWQIAIYTVQKI